MTRLGDDFRKRAADYNGTAVALFGAPDFGIDAKKQAGAVVAKVTANTLQLLGEVVDYLRASEDLDESAKHREATLEKSNAIRNAAARGDWDEFDRLAKEFGGGGASGGVTTPGGS